MISHESTNDRGYSQQRESSHPSSPPSSSSYPRPSHSSVPYSRPVDNGPISPYDRAFPQLSRGSSLASPASDMIGRYQLESFDSVRPNHSPTIIDTDRHVNEMRVDSSNGNQSPSSHMAILLSPTSRSVRVNDAPINSNPTDQQSSVPTSASTLSPTSVLGSSIGSIDPKELEAQQLAQLQQIQAKGKEQHLQQLLLHQQRYQQQHRQHPQHPHLYINSPPTNSPTHANMQSPLVSPTISSPVSSTHLPHQSAPPSVSAPVNSVHSFPTSVSALTSPIGQNVPSGILTLHQTQTPSQIGSLPNPPLTRGGQHDTVKHYTPQMAEQEQQPQQQQFHPLSQSLDPPSPVSISMSVAEASVMGPSLHPYQLDADPTKSQHNQFDEDHQMDEDGPTNNPVDPNHDDSNLVVPSYQAPSPTQSNPISSSSQFHTVTTASSQSLSLSPQSIESSSSESSSTSGSSSKTAANRPASLSSHLNHSPSAPAPSTISTNTVVSTASPIHPAAAIGMSSVSPSAESNSQSHSHSDSVSSPPSIPSITNWRKGELLGQGAYGQVFLGLNTDTGQLLAVKQVQLSKERSKASDQLISALESEIALMAGLVHDNIVRYVGSQRSSHHLNIFLEFVSGGSLAGVLKTFGRFSEKLVKLYIKQILAGLQYLHQHNIIHRSVHRPYYDRNDILH